MLHTLDKITQKDLDVRLVSPWWSETEREEAVQERDRRITKIFNMPGQLLEHIND
jgi:hypothetical protein